MRLVAAPDKFKSTTTAAQVAAAVARAAAAVGASCEEAPMADGGEGFLEVLGGANRSAVVTGPLGDPVEAGWRLGKSRVAVVEMAAASGLELVGGAESNDAVAASTYGVGELIAHALEAGAKRVIVGVGGSATTDGGLGALRALYPNQRLRGVEMIVACDVRTRFVDAAEVFAPQKGASAAEVGLLRRRLERLAGAYLDDYGLDVTDLVGGGAGGGLAGGLAAVGGELASGFDVVAEEVDLESLLEGADLVVTGEGFLDAESFDGKVVGGVAVMAARLGVSTLAVVGERFDVGEQLDGPGAGMEVISLTELFGSERAHQDPLSCIEEAVADHLRAGRST